MQVELIDGKSIVLDVSLTLCQIHDLICCNSEIIKLLKYWSRICLFSINGDLGFRMFVLNPHRALLISISMFIFIPPQGSPDRDLHVRFDPPTLLSWYMFCNICCMTYRSFRQTPRMMMMFLTIWHYHKKRSLMSTGFEVWVVQAMSIYDQVSLLIKPSWLVSVYHWTDLLNLFPDEFKVLVCIIAENCNRIWIMLDIVLFLNIILHFKLINYLFWFSSLWQYWGRRWKLVWICRAI